MNPNPSRMMAAALLVAAGGLLAACETGANGTPQVETITVAAQDTTPPEFAAMVEIENGKQVTPPTTANTTTGWSTTLGPGPSGTFRVYTEGDNLGILVTAHDDESGIQKVEVLPNSGHDSCSSGPIGTTSGPGLASMPLPLGPKAGVNPGDEVARWGFGNATVAVVPGDTVEVAVRVTDNFGNESTGSFRVDLACTPTA
jgi:hypothetical protein